MASVSREEPALTIRPSDVDPGKVLAGEGEAARSSALHLEHREQGGRAMSASGARRITRSLWGARVGVRRAADDDLVVANGLAMKSIAPRIEGRRCRSRPRRVMITGIAARRGVVGHRFEDAEASRPAGCDRGGRRRACGPGRRQDGHAGAGVETEKPASPRAGRHPLEEPGVGIPMTMMRAGLGGGRALVADDPLDGDRDRCSPRSAGSPNSRPMPGWRPRARPRRRRGRGTPGGGHQASAVGAIATWTSVPISRARGLEEHAGARESWRATQRRCPIANTRPGDPS